MAAWGDAAEVTPSYQVVHMTQHAVHGRLPPGRLVTWLPTIVGLCLIPFLPIIDEPCEHVVSTYTPGLVRHSLMADISLRLQIDALFDAAWPTGEEAKAH